MAEGKSIAVYQPYFFPYPGYWQLLDAVDVFVVGDQFQYTTRGFINRNRLLVDHAARRFTVSLAGASPRRRIDEVEVRDDFRKFRRTLAQAYARAPYYREAMAVIDPILDHPDRNLARFLGNQLVEVARHLGLRARIVPMSALGLGDQPRDRVQRLVACVRALGGDRLVNPLGSASLYRAADFRAEGIRLQLLQPRTFAYPQCNRGFVPDLSLIDAMMWNAPRALAALLRGYDLVDAP